MEYCKLKKLKVSLRGIFIFTGIWFGVSYAKIIFQSMKDAPTTHRRYWELYSMEEDGSDVERITYNLYWESQPDVSPDGKRVVFAIHYNPDSLTEETDPGWEIAIMNIDGTGLKRLTANEHLDCCPHWNRDGTRIVYVSGRHEENGDLIATDIYTMTPDGDSIIRLTDAGIGEFYADPSFSFSNQESKILYVYCKQKVTGWDIWMMNEDGGDKHLILATNEHYLAYHDPMFSPDDSMIVFEAMLSPDGNHGIPLYKIFTAKVNGVDVKQITDSDDETDVYPQYFADGNRLVYFTWRWNERDSSFERKIRTIDTAGTNERILSVFSPEIYPSWYQDIEGIEESKEDISFETFFGVQSSKINFQIYKPARIDIYDIQGKRIKSLFKKVEGFYKIVWDMTDDSGKRVPKGIYFCKLNSGGKVKTLKILFR